jgi:Flp pilus assembly pilin Flp
MRNKLRHLWKDEEGQDSTEYGLLLALVALFAISTMKTLANGIHNVFSNAAASLSTT